jgi:hypothetical protein
MRGLGDFQRAQMRDADPRIPELFSHLRHATELLDQIASQPHGPAAEPKRSAYPISTPIRRIWSGCCARVARGHAATAPSKSVTNSRRCMSAPKLIAIVPA